jgi:hypothetical protein
VSNAKKAPRPRAGSTAARGARWASDAERLAERERLIAANDEKRRARITRGFMEGWAIYDAIEFLNLEPAADKVAELQPSVDAIVFLAFHARKMEEIVQQLQGQLHAMKRWQDQDTDRKRVRAALAAGARTIADLERADPLLFDPQGGEDRKQRRRALSIQLSKVKRGKVLP